MRWPTADETNAVLRHVYTGVGVATATLVLVGLSQGNATAIGDAVHQIGSGIASIVAGVGTLISVGSALWAAWSSSPFARLLQANNNPEIKQVIAVPGTQTAELAKQIPGDKVTAK